MHWQTFMHNATASMAQFERFFSNYSYVNNDVRKRILQDTWKKWIIIYFGTWNILHFGSLKNPYFNLKFILQVKLLKNPKQKKMKRIHSSIRLPIIYNHSSQIKTNMLFIFWARIWIFSSFINAVECPKCMQISDHSLARTKSYA